MNSEVNKRDPWALAGSKAHGSCARDERRALGGKMKPRIKQPEPSSRLFWAVHVRSKSGIAHLVKPEIIDFLKPYLAEYPVMYWSACGRSFASFEIQSSGSRGIGAPRCKRCMAAKEENNQ